MTGIQMRCRRCRRCRRLSRFVNSYVYFFWVFFGFSKVFFGFFFCLKNPKKRHCFKVYRSLAAISTHLLLIYRVVIFWSWMSKDGSEYG